MSEFPQSGASASTRASAAAPRARLSLGPSLLLTLASACLNPAISDEPPISESTPAVQTGDAGTAFDEPAPADPDDSLDEDDEPDPVLVFVPSSDEAPSRGRRQPGARRTRR